MINNYSTDCPFVLNYACAVPGIYFSIRNMRFVVVVVVCENKLRIQALFTNLPYMVIQVFCIAIESSQLFVWCISKWVACSKISLRYRGLYSR